MSFYRLARRVDDLGQETAHERSSFHQRLPSVISIDRSLSCFDHLKKPSAVGPIVIHHIQTVFLWLVCIRQAVPRFKVKVAGGRLVASSQ